MVKGTIIFTDNAKKEFKASYTKLREGWYCLHYEKKPGETTFHQEFIPAHTISSVFQDSDQAPEKREGGKH